MLDDVHVIRFLACIAGIAVISIFAAASSDLHPLAVPSARGFFRLCV